MARRLHVFILTVGLTCALAIWLFSLKSTPKLLPEKQVAENIPPKPALEFAYVPVTSPNSGEKFKTVVSPEVTKDPLAALDDPSPEIQAGALEAPTKKASPVGKEKAMKIVVLNESEPVTSRAITYLGRINAHDAFLPVQLLAMKTSSPQLNRWPSGIWFCVAVVSTPPKR